MEDHIENSLVEKRKFKLNRNIVLVIIIVVLLAVAALLLLRLRHPEHQETITVQKFKSNDETVSIEALSNFEFNVQHIEGYDLSIYSNKYNSSVFISKVPTTNIRDINKFIEADKKDYITKFSNISDVSEVTETTVNNLPAYNYHFNYSTNMYVEVYLVLKDKQLYIIDFNLNKDKEDLMNYLPELLNSVII